MNNLVTAYAEDGGSENLTRVGINDDFNKPLCFTLLDSTRHSAHWPLSNQEALPRPSRLGFCQTRAAQWRIHIKGIGRKAVADAATILLKKISRDDLIVIISCVGEGALAVAVAERPDVGHGGTQLVVDRNVAVLVGFYTGRVKTQIIGIGAAADSEQYMGADDLLSSGLAVNADRDV